jgi:hypothetical protein
LIASVFQVFEAPVITAGGIESEPVRLARITKTYFWIRWMVPGPPPPRW